MARVTTKTVNGVTYVEFKCPGCRGFHSLPVTRRDGSQGPTWGFNGDTDRPTLTPSILSRSGHYAAHAKPGECYCGSEHEDKASGFCCGICHSYVTSGRIQFLTDCTHALAGQTVDLPENAG